MGKRIWFAEDIADIMERMQSQTLQQIADDYGLERKTIDNMLQLARKGGFAAYPMRSEDGKCQPKR